MAEDIELRLQPLLDEDPTDMDLIAVAPEPKRKRRGWLIALAAVLVVGLVGSSLAYFQATKKPAVTFTQATVTTGNLSLKVSATGPIGAKAQYNMNFASAGQVREIDVQIGQHVKQGQVLAKVTVDMTALQDNLNQAQIGVNAAQASLNAANSSLGNQQASNAASLNVARDQENDALNVCKTEANPPADCVQVAQNKFAQAQSQINSSNSAAWSQVTSAQISLNRAVAQLQAAQHSLDSANANTNLTSPVDANVAAINGAIGQSVGASSTQPFIILTDTSKLSIAALVNEADIGSIQVGQPAQFSVTAYPSATFRASVAAIETIGQTTSNVVNYTVMLVVDQNSLNGQHIYPGMTATVNITTAQRIGALLLPSAALSFPSVALQNGEIDRSVIASLVRNGQRGQGGQPSGSRLVLVLHNGKLTPVMITTGISSGQFTEVLSGLNDGDQVVVGQTGGTTSTNTARPGGGAGGNGGFGGGGGGGGAPFRNGGGG